MIDSFEPEFRKYFEVVIWCLETYHECKHESAIEIVEDFCAQFPDSYQTDICIRSDPFELALDLQYKNEVVGTETDPGFQKWRKQIGYEEVPDEAVRYWWNHTTEE